jgi:hypothetical protein
MPTWVGCCAAAGVRSSGSPCAFRHGHDPQRGAANSACASNFRGGKCRRCEPPTAQRWSTRGTSVTPEDIDPAAGGGALVTGCVCGRSRPACNSGTACATRIRHPAVACGTCSGHVRRMWQRQRGNAACAPATRHPGASAEAGAYLELQLLVAPMAALLIIVSHLQPSSVRTRQEGASAWARLPRHRGQGGRGEHGCSGPAARGAPDAMWVWRAPVRLSRRGAAATASAVARDARDRAPPRTASAHIAAARQRTNMMHGPPSSTRQAANLAGRRAGAVRRCRPLSANAAFRRFRCEREGDCSNCHHNSFTPAAARGGVRPAVRAPRSRGQNLHCSCAVDSPPLPSGIPPPPLTPLLAR